MSKTFAGAAFILVITLPLFAVQRRDDGDRGAVLPISRLIAKVSEVIQAAVDDWTIGNPKP